MHFTHVQTYSIKLHIVDQAPRKFGHSLRGGPCSISIKIGQQQMKQKAGSKITQWLLADWPVNFEFSPNLNGAKII